jgi:hypothetical protein
MLLHSACSDIEVITIHCPPEGSGCEIQSAANQDLTPIFPYVEASPAQDIDLAVTPHFLSPFISIPVAQLVCSDSSLSLSVFSIQGVLTKGLHC